MNQVEYGPWMRRYGDVLDCLLGGLWMPEVGVSGTEVTAKVTALDSDADFEGGCPGSLQTDCVWTRRWIP